MKTPFRIRLRPLLLLLSLLLFCGTASAQNISTASVTLTNAEEKAQNDMGGHVYVDLDLPSGLLWATMNVGASSPEDYGDYFAWGETTAKSKYSWNTYKWCNGSVKTLIKYNTDSKCGTVDKKTVLDLSDDAARANWGGCWRMATTKEWKELKNTDNCTWTWTSKGGHNGYKVTSKRNGNSLFLPAAGCYWNSELCDADDLGYYWSSSLNVGYPLNAWRELFYSDEMTDWFGSNRDLGFSVRPVCCP